MPIALPFRGKTVKIRANITTAGMEPGQMAEVDDNAKTRAFISAGIWTMLLTQTEYDALQPKSRGTAKVVPVEEPTQLDLPLDGG
jgi:hypothetical protein